MGRQAVVQITCDRCTRIEHRPFTEGKDDPEIDRDKQVDFAGIFLGEQIQFRDLCAPCQDIVRGHWEQINKALRKSSPRRPKSNG